MSITLYNTSDGYNVMYKHLSGNGIAYNCIFKNGCSLKRPIVEISKDIYSLQNYCYISDFSRYYYINDVILENGGKAVLYCTCDALSSHAGELGNTEQTIIRTADEKSKNSKIPDTKIPISQQFLESVAIGTNQSLSLGDSYILTVLGGANGTIAEPEPDTEQTGG